VAKLEQPSPNRKSICQQCRRGHIGGWLPPFRLRRTGSGARYGNLAGGAFRL